MKDKDEFHEKRMQMWKKREEMINSMSVSELRAFINGYMMGEHMAFRRVRKMIKSQCGGGCCGGNSCGCEGNNCNCEESK